MSSRTPHDGIRLGLPVGALAVVPGPGEEDQDGALLVAAALLLAGAAGGGLVAGLLGRRLTRLA